MERISFECNLAPSVHLLWLTVTLMILRTRSAELAGPQK
jgi:hypothetical protein